MPGSSTTPDKILKQGYQDNKGILLRQVELYEPDIVIGGNTVHLFYEDLDIPRDKLLSLDNNRNEYYAKENRLYIDAYHPAIRGGTVQTYCNDIIEMAKQWLNSK